MKVLVTGGSGFIGRAVVAELVKRNIDVVSFDIVPPKTHIDGVQYAQGTILDKFALSDCMQGCDAVFHLAALLGVKRVEDHLLSCLNINILGTLSVMEACVSSGVGYILLTSSSEIFGEGDGSKLGETSSYNPKSGYAVSKLAAEEFVKAFHKEFGLEYNILRLFNVYGPGQITEFVIPRFIKMVEKGKAPTIYGDGNQVRSFCYVTDVTRAAVDLFLNETLRNEAFNVGNDTEPVTIVEVAQKICKIMNSSLEPRFLPFTESDRKETREIFNRIPDISKLVRLANYTPEISLEEGVRQIITLDDIPESRFAPI